MPFENVSPYCSKKAKPVHSGRFEVFLWDVSPYCSKKAKPVHSGRFEVFLWNVSPLRTQKAKHGAESPLWWACSECGHKKTPGRMSARRFFVCNFFVYCPSFFLRSRYHSLYTSIMSDVVYMYILRVFLVSVPIGLIASIFFAVTCIRSKDTNQPGFWLALVYIGMLLPEIIRSLYILNGEMPAHPKQLQFWIGELAITGGFWYEMAKRYLKVVFEKLKHD